ncbi:MAG: hypothetical protein P8I91_03415 [Phycisphaerales bacterium]|nr:hypothetical protein [Phycisphaerales bacterium]
MMCGGHLCSISHRGVVEEIAALAIAIIVWFRLITQPLAVVLLDFPHTPMLWVQKFT